jgi:hypothetical protein
MHQRHAHSPFLNSQTPNTWPHRNYLSGSANWKPKERWNRHHRWMSQQRRRSARHKGRWGRAGIAPAILNIGTVWVQLNWPVCLHGRRRLVWRHSRAGHLGESYFVPIGNLTTAMRYDPELDSVSPSCHEVHISHIVSECRGLVDGRVFVFQPRQRSRYSD